MYNLFVFFLLLAACGKTVLCETCSESVRPQQSCTRARHMFVLNEIDPFFLLTASCSESQGSLQNLYRAL